MLVPGRFEPPVTVIMLSPGVSGASRHLGFVASLLSVSIGALHIDWLVFTVRGEQWISSTTGSIRSDTENALFKSRRCDTNIVFIAT